MALPSGYTKLEYIESTGTQYIDTGVSAPTGFRITCDVVMTSIPNSLNMLFGSHDTSPPYYRNYLAATNGGKWEIGAYNPCNFGSVSANTKYSIDVCTISGAVGCSINGVSQSIDTSIAASTVRSSRSVYLFGLNYTDGLLPASMKLYGLQMYLDAEKNALVRDYVPCINASGVVGMWDDVNGQFYQNAGTGSFIAGEMPKGTHKTLVNGTIYDVQGGKCRVNGTVYDIKKGRTLINGTGYDITFKPSYDPVFANNTWEQIIAACHNNAVPDTWKVADQKPMTINGVDYQIDIIGKNHDTYTAGGKAPLTFQMHDSYVVAKNMNSSDTSSGGWTSCAMRSTHLPAILALMPTEVQNGIREVNKLTSAGGNSATINTTADKLFLLSEIEIFGSVKWSKSGEGTQYDYYKAGNSTVKNLISSAYFWWARSPRSIYDFCSVQKSGVATFHSASNTIGVAFGFCF